MLAPSSAITQSTLTPEEKHVFAQADPSGNGEWKSESIRRPKGRLSPDNSTDMLFNYPYKWRKSEKKHSELPPADYVAAATVQLFVTINEYHDLLYAYGFDEASGNFRSTTLVAEVKVMMVSSLSLRTVPEPTTLTL